jgi:hypothetical protein
MTDTSGTSIEDLLSAVTDALLAEDEGDLKQVTARYRGPQADVEHYVSLIRRLHLSLAGVQPSPRFVRRLKHDLMGTPDRNVVSRMRHLPARVQIAAGVALVAGFMLFSRRRMLQDAQEETGQETAPALDM